MDRKLAILVKIISPAKYELHLCYYRRVRQAEAYCKQIELVGDRVRIHFETDLIPAPGQLVLARLAATADPYLRLPFFPSALSQTGFAVDVTSSHSALRLLAPGSTVDLIGPVGIQVGGLPPRSRLLLIADSDPAVLLPFASQAIAAGGTATLLLARPYPLDALDPEIEIRMGDLLSLTAEFAAADRVLIHTNPALHQPLRQKLAEARAFVPPDYAYALVNRSMPCGIGACGACAVKTGRGWKWACLDGPFFSLAKLEV
jgi:dihydroorotate dehydrogenase electron transfer subunit